MTEQANTWGIDDLDGLTSTIVAITIGPWDVMVGGGPDRFIITATTDAGQRVANALSGAPASAEEDTVELTVGGQTVDYPSEYALTRGEVDAAITDLRASHFPADRWEILC